MAIAEAKNPDTLPSAAFEKAVDKGRTLVPTPEGFESLIEQLAKFHHTVKDGILTIPLKKTHIAGAVAKAVAMATMYPALQDHIVFMVGEEKRPYHDIVWNLQECGLKLARQIYRENQKREKSPIRIIVTPPVIGRDPVMSGVYPCRILEETGKEGRKIRLHTMIAYDHAIETGLRHIVQTDDIALTSADGSLASSNVLSLMIKVQPVHLASFELPGRKIQLATAPAHHHV